MLSPAALLCQLPLPFPSSRKAILHSAAAPYLRIREGLLRLVRARRAKAQPDRIDQQISEDARPFVRECKILVLGASGSGKTTIVKQMKMRQDSGLSSEEHLAYCAVVWQSFLESARTVLDAVERSGVELSDPSCKIILKYEVNAVDTSCQFSPDVARAVHDMWRDEITAIMFSDTPDLYLMDNGRYFLEHALRIGATEYVPTDEDIVMARSRSAPLPETQFTMNMLTLGLLSLASRAQIGRNGCMRSKM